MLNKCWSCVYHDEELDQGGGSFCVCTHPNRDCSFPKICPMTFIKDDYIRPEERTCNTDFLIRNK